MHQVHRSFAVCCRRLSRVKEELLGSSSLFEREKNKWLFQESPVPIKVKDQYFFPIKRGEQCRRPALSLRHTSQSVTSGQVSRTLFHTQRKRYIYWQDSFIAHAHDRIMIAHGKLQFPSQPSSGSRRRRGKLRLSKLFVTKTNIKTP